MPGLESLFWRGIRLPRRRGEEKKQLGPEKFFSAFQEGSTGKASQDKPTQAKGCLRGQMTFSESLADRKGWIQQSSP
jgi:hypothetical protein